MSVERERGPYYDAQAIAAHDMALEEGDDCCPDWRTCWICRSRYTSMGVPKSQEFRDDCDSVTDNRTDWRDLPW